MKLKYNSTSSQPIGLYGVTDYKGTIMGLSVYSNICEVNYSG